MARKTRHGRKKSNEHKDSLIGEIKKTKCKFIRKFKTKNSVNSLKLSGSEIISNVCSDKRRMRNLRNKNRSRSEDNLSIGSGKMTRMHSVKDRLRESRSDNRTITNHRNRAVETIDDAEIPTSPSYALRASRQLNYKRRPTQQIQQTSLLKRGGEDIRQRRERIACNEYYLRDTRRGAFDTTPYTTGRQRASLKPYLGEDRADFEDTRVPTTAAKIKEKRQLESARRWDRLQNGIYDDLGRYGWARDDEDDDDLDPLCEGSAAEAMAQATASSWNCGVAELRLLEAEEEGNRSAAYLRRSEREMQEEGVTSMYSDAHLEADLVATGNGHKPGSSFQTVNVAKDGYQYMVTRSRAARKSPPPRKLHYRKAYRQRRDSDIARDNERIQAEMLRPNYSNIGQGPSPKHLPARTKAFLGQTPSPRTPQRTVLNLKQAETLKKSILKKNSKAVKRLRGEPGKGSGGDNKLGVISSLIDERDRVGRGQQKARHWASVKSSVTVNKTTGIATAEMDGEAQTDKSRRRTQRMIEDTRAELQGPRAKKSRML